jgi:hypothetical protein
VEPDADPWPAYLNEQMQQQAARVDRRFRATEQRLDATRTQLDQMRLQLSAQLGHTKADLARLVLLGVLGTTAATAAMCLATLVLVL